MAFWVTISDVPNQQEVERASLAVRNSRGVKVEHLVEATSHYSHVDGRGLMFLTYLDKQKSHFERQVILLALAQAYLGAMGNINDQLSQAVSMNDSDTGGEKKLREIYLHTAKFNARYMFRLPVKGMNAGLVACWKRVSDALKINDFNDELNQ